MILRNLSCPRLSISSPCVSELNRVSSCSQLTHEHMNVTDYTGISKIFSILSFTRTPYTSSDESEKTKQTVSPVAKSRYAYRKWVWNWEMSNKETAMLEQLEFLFNFSFSSLLYLEDHGELVVRNILTSNLNMYQRTHSKIKSFFFHHEVLEEANFCYSVLT